MVKLGTGVLTDSRKQPDLAQMEQLVGQIADLGRDGKEIVLVSSGIANSWIVFDNSGRWPREIAFARADVSTIVDEEAFRAFTRTGEEP